MFLYRLSNRWVSKNPKNYKQPSSSAWSRVGEKGGRFCSSFVNQKETRVSFVKLNVEEKWRARNRYLYISWKLKWSLSILHNCESKVRGLIWTKAVDFCGIIATGVAVLIHFLSWNLDYKFQSTPDGFSDSISLTAYLCTCVFVYLQIACVSVVPQQPEQEEQHGLACVITTVAQTKVLGELGRWWVCLDQRLQEVPVVWLAFQNHLNQLQKATQGTHKLVS